MNDDAKILVRLRQVIRLRHYAKNAEKTYLHWSRRFLEYRRGTGCEGSPTAENAKAFLTRLAMVENVSASTQNQAFSALLLLFREVLRTDLEEMAQTVRAKRGRTIKDRHRFQRESLGVTTGEMSAIFRGPRKTHYADD